jgi:hypothetical protein
VKFDNVYGQDRGNLAYRNLTVGGAGTLPADGA